MLIESEVRSGRRTVAAGVILQIRGGVAYIATARHVVDGAFNGGLAAEPEPSALKGFSVLTIDQVRAAATVEWVAPHGIDLAILSAPLSSRQVQAAHWNRGALPQVGSALFTIGNPGGAGWTQASGTLAQIRDQEQQHDAFQMLQTNMALQPGHSGGGLYDAAGQLIGINAMTGLGRDPRFPGGLGLSTALASLLDLAPQRFALPATNPNRGPTPHHHQQPMETRQR
ncbi:MAG: serine protease [bacterium]